MRPEHGTVGMNGLKSSSFPHARHYSTHRPAQRRSLHCLTFSCLSKNASHGRTNNLKKTDRQTDRQKERKKKQKNLDTSEGSGSEIWNYLVVVCVERNDDGVEGPEAEEEGRCAVL